VWSSLERARLLVRFYPVIPVVLILPVLIVALALFTPSPMVKGRNVGPGHVAGGAEAGRGSPLGIPGSWKLVFDSEFNAASSLGQVAHAAWRFGGPGVVGEEACYSSSNVTFPGDGTVHLGITPTESMCGGRSYRYTSASINTDPAKPASGISTGFQFSYGVVEALVYLAPSASSVIVNWPAVWATSRDWPATGEDDVMEGLGGSACFHFHYALSSGAPTAIGSCARGDFTGWHVFASDWEPGSVTYYYDGIQVGRITRGITSAPMYLVIDNAIGSQGGPVAVPSDLRVSYVKVWQR
jgi:beta-glucanase (GH16 family)